MEKEDTVGGKIDPGPEVLAFVADTRKPRLEKCWGKGKRKERKNISNKKLGGLGNNPVIT